MKRFFIGLVAFLLVLVVAGCPVIFDDPLRIDDQRVNEGETLSFDLKQYTTARNMEDLKYDLLDENPAWYIFNDSYFVFENVPFKNPAYEVRVGVTNDRGATVTDSFKIYVNRFPEEPVAVFPENGATEISTEVTLEWTCTDPDEDYLTFSVFFGDAEDQLDMVIENTPLTSHELGVLEPATEYFWKVIASDEHGASTTGELWSFRTVKPTPEGPKMMVIEPEGKGTVTPEPGTYVFEEGEVVRLSAEPEEGWKFTKWEINGQESEEAELNIEMHEDKTAKAFFSLKEYSIEASAEPEGSGLVNGVAVFEEVFSHGERVELIAQELEGFSFLEWSGDVDGVNKKEPVLAFDADRHRNLVAHFELKKHTLTVTAVPEEAGEVTGEGVFEHGETVEVSVVPNDGWIFVEWQINGIVSDKLVVEFEIEEDTSATAIFREDTRPYLRIFSLPQDGMELSINGEIFFTPVEFRVPEGSEHHVVVQRVQEFNLYDYPNRPELRGVDSIFEFARWDDGYTENEKIVIVDEETELTMVFDAKYRVESGSYPHGAADPGNEGWHEEGSKILFEVPLEATIMQGGEERLVPFDYWTLNRRDDRIPGESSNGKSLLLVEVIEPTFVQARYNLPCSN